MAIDQLLAMHCVDLATLEPAPAGASVRDACTRICQVPPWPCTACGEPSPVARIMEPPELGPRWVDLCRDHALAVWRPAPGMPATLEGIVADLREVAAELGDNLIVVTDDDFRRSVP